MKELSEFQHLVKGTIGSSAGENSKMLCGFHKIDKHHRFEAVNGFEYNVNDCILHFLDESGKERLVIQCSDTGSYSGDTYYYVISDDGNDIQLIAKEFTEEGCIGYTQGDIRGVMLRVSIWRLTKCKKNDNVCFCTSFDKPRFGCIHSTSQQGFFVTEKEKTVYVSATNLLLMNLTD